MFKLNFFKKRKSNQVVPKKFILTKDLYEKNKIAKQYCLKLNNSTSSIEKNKIMEQLFKSYGNDVKILDDFHCDFGSNITIGNNVFINIGCIILDEDDVTIGNNVFIGPRVGIYTSNHSIDIRERNQGVNYVKPVFIGDNVWIGAGVIILPGVTIGDNVTIGAGSVVTKNIPKNVVVAGNPCKIIRKLKNDS